MSENGAGYEDLGFAKLDTNREQRTGFPRWCSVRTNPTPTCQRSSSAPVAADGRPGTRASERRQPALLCERSCPGNLRPVSRILSVTAPEVPVPQVGHVAVVCAGTGGHTGC